MFNQARSAAQPRLTGNKLPAEYVSALRRTPLGLGTLEMIGGFDPSRPLKVEITSDPLESGDHAQTILTRKGLSTVISTDNTAVGDRMNGWSSQEMINIVGIHEGGHYVVTPQGAVADQCYCFLCDCHIKVIFTELMARFQYSLIQTAASPKSGWLNNYLGYFAKSAKMQADPGFASLCDAYAQAPANSPEREQAASSAQAYEQQHAPQVPFDSTRAEAMALKAYDDALNHMGNFAAQFASDGLYEDIGPFKRVIAEMDSFQADRRFSLVP
jgi:hypothetical protein